MKKIAVSIFLFSIFCLLPSASVYAVYDPLSVPNNKFGIHILFPSELTQAAKLVNSSGGQWGYVTIPIQSNDRNLEKWQDFFNQAKKFKVIPILRLATYPDGAIWTKPTIYDPLDWANFLDSLDWPTKNRYVIVYNEPNRALEWGGQVDPGDYAQQLVWTIDELKKRNDKFFVLPAALDASAPNNNTFLDEYSFLVSMHANQPGIFSKIDAWNSHSYPNPGFSASPQYSGKEGIKTYQWELNFLQNYYGLYGLKVFITETGWDKNKLGEEKVKEYLKFSYENIWNDSYLVAVTPFLLSASAGEFTKFSWLDQNLLPNTFYKGVESLKKIAGSPLEEPTSTSSFSLTAHEANVDWSAQKTNIWHKTTKEWLKKIMNWLLTKETATNMVTLQIGDTQIQAKLARTAAEKGKGLGKVSSLPENEGMFFVMDKIAYHPFWMKDMQFPLDLIWISGKKIVDITENVPVSLEKNPPVIRPKKPANYVLEVNAGFVQRHNIHLDDVIEYTLW